ncbi:MAG: hypothetical protein V4456_02825 [Bacteroidota bacterium]
MSVTYNWAYKPGVANKYGININASADNVRPSNACYIALYGNDATGNGSRQYPYRTLGKAVSLYNSVTYILSSGTYREINNSGNAYGLNIIGDGDVIIDVTYNGYMFGSGAGLQSLRMYNIKLKGAGDSFMVSSGDTAICVDCTFNGAIPNPIFFTSAGDPDTRMVNCVITNYVNPIRLALYNGYGSIDNCTFINLNSITIGKHSSCVFKRCNVYSQGLVGYPRYSLFYQCNFSFTTTTAGALYPSVSTGWYYYSDINTLRNAALIANPTLSNLFQGCIINDPLFNNESIGDYSLLFNSPAKNLSYFGTYAGARSIGQSIKARANESIGGFEFSSAVNLTIADDSITLINPTIDAQIDTKVIVNTLAREIASLPSFGFNADRNGQYIDSIADLDTVTKSASDPLGVPIPYIVEVGAIVYNGKTYQPGERFTTVVGQTTFTTVASGILREILETPQRHTIMVRFSDGGLTVSAGDALTIGYCYFVASGSIIYNSTTYNAGEVFKAINTNAFSGLGDVLIAFSNESYQHYEPGIKPTSNNFGDSRTGAIVRGNGDPAYIRGGLGVQEFPINSKFIQIRYFIRVNNLKP